MRNKVSTRDFIAWLTKCAEKGTEDNGGENYIQVFITTSTGNPNVHYVFQDVDYDELNNEILKTLLALDDLNKPVDPITISTRPTLRFYINTLSVSYGHNLNDITLHVHCFVQAEPKLHITFE